MNKVALTVQYLYKLENSNLWILIHFKNFLFLNNGCVYIFFIELYEMVLIYTKRSTAANVYFAGLIGRQQPIMINKQKLSAKFLIAHG